MIQLKVIFLSLFLLLYLPWNKSSAGEQNKVVIENNLFTKTISSNSDKPDKIEVQLISKTKNKKLTSDTPVPYFEFVINNQLISSQNPFWIFKEHTSRTMQNNGIEHQLVFEGLAGPVNGLQVVLYQQIFPNSTLMREKLVLQSENKTFELNKLNGKLHFKFPVYSLVNAKNSEVELTEIRIATWEKKPVSFGDQKKGNHMYYPDIITYKLRDIMASVKGPVSILSNNEISWFTAYEHASQDNLNGLFDRQLAGKGNLINDAMQGTKGFFNFPISEEDFKFIGIGAEKEMSQTTISVDILRGGYLEDEKIDKEHPYSTVWTATGFYPENNLEVGKSMLRNYLFNQICEKPASRIPDFYYNTWGLQRQDRNKPLRGILTYDRIFEEIDYAAELDVDIFVLDDGWENAMGEWFPNKERFPNGLAPIKERLDKHGIKMGLWYSPMGIDSTSQRYKDHPEWVIKDSEGKPIQAQWGQPAFDFVSDFFDVFITDCKKMIDEGCRFMKWDAINTFYSSLPNLRHGSDKYPESELRARYEYLLPIYVVRAMEILTNYEPDLVIEIDLTEARRAMVGLAPLSQGKFFWMNNGASWYNDYTTYRTKSMRTIANEFKGIIPLELFTYANYPQNIEGAMHYNVHNSILAGHGFWGNLQLTSVEDRTWIGQQVAISKGILPYLVDVTPEVIGKVGDSPEIYTIVNSEKAAGQVIAFSENPSQKEHYINLNTDNLLGILNSPFIVEKNSVHLPLNFDKKESSVAIFVLQQNEASKGITIMSSSVPIDNVTGSNKQLRLITTDPGEINIRWPEIYGQPIIKCSGKIDFIIENSVNYCTINIVTQEKNSEIIIQKN